MDRHLAASLDHWLTTPPDHDEPDYDIDSEIDVYLDFLGLQNLPNNEDSLDRYLFLNPDLDQELVVELTEYVASEGEVE